MKGNLKETKECNAICNNQGCNCKHEPPCCHSVFVYIPTKKETKDDFIKNMTITRKKIIKQNKGDGTISFPICGNTLNYSSLIFSLSGIYPNKSN